MMKFLIVVTTALITTSDVTGTRSCLLDCGKRLWWQGVLSRPRNPNAASNIHYGCVVDDKRFDDNDDFTAFDSGTRSIDYQLNECGRQQHQGQDWIEDAQSSPSEYSDSCTEILPRHNEPTIRPGIRTVRPVNRVKMWPPWPLNLLTNQNAEAPVTDQEDSTSAVDTYPSAAALFWAYSRGKARVWVRQVQEVGSQLWFNLPPAAPPLLLLASIPRTVLVENQETGEALKKTIFPIVSNAFARNLALSGLGLAVMSWAHMEVNRKRRLTPLLAVGPNQSVSRVFLPPYLPEEVPEPDIAALQSAEESVGQAIKQENDGQGPNPESYVMSMVSPRIRKQLYQLYENAPSPRTLQTTLREWKRMREVRQREAAKIRRLSIFDELVALQALKRKSARRKQSNAITNSVGMPGDAETPGHALVTGASQGIGRAIAVELARWEIPLILVARDLNRLISLAYDLELCYGVKCCVLQADLSQPHAAEKIYRTTHEAGLSVDILVNNAGFSTDGLAVDIGVSDVERMVMVNAMAYAKLSGLYGRDMKERKRGRILMVSSMCGLTSASPNTAVYGATKAFAKSLSFSMAKELEPYGVGVTCLMPGPVVDTEFRSRSGTSKAVCWYLPFYPRPAHSVAHQAVTSLLDGDTQVIPGVLNRVFSKLFRPILPQRVEIMSVHFAWSPLHLRAPNFVRNRDEETTELQHPAQATKVDVRKSASLSQRQPYRSHPPPRLLKLPELENPTSVAPKPVSEGNPREQSGSQGPDDVKGSKDENGPHNDSPGESIGKQRIEGDDKDGTTNEMDSTKDDKNPTSLVDKPEVESVGEKNVEGDHQDGTTNEKDCAKDHETPASLVDKTQGDGGGKKMVEGGQAHSSGMIDTKEGTKDDESTPTSLVDGERKDKTNASAKGHDDIVGKSANIEDG